MQLPATDEGKKEESNYSMYCFVCFVFCFVLVRFFLSFLMTKEARSLEQALVFHEKGINAFPTPHRHPPHPVFKTNENS